MSDFLINAYRYSLTFHPHVSCPPVCVTEDGFRVADRTSGFSINWLQLGDSSGDIGVLGERPAGDDLTAIRSGELVFLVNGKKREIVGLTSFPDYTINGPAIVEAILEDRAKVQRKAGAKELRSLFTERTQIPAPSRPEEFVATFRELCSNGRCAEVRWLLDPLRVLVCDRVSYIIDLANDYRISYYRLAALDPSCVCAEPHGAGWVVTVCERSGYAPVYVSFVVSGEGLLEEIREGEPCKGLTRIIHQGSTPRLDLGVSALLSRFAACDVPPGTPRSLMARAGSPGTLLAPLATIPDEQSGLMRPSAVVRTGRGSPPLRSAEFIQVEEAIRDQFEILAVPWTEQGYGKTYTAQQAEKLGLAVNLAAVMAPEPLATYIRHVEAEYCPRSLLRRAVTSYLTAEMSADERKEYLDAMKTAGMTPYGTPRRWLQCL